MSALVHTPWIISDDTEEYDHSEDIRGISAASPLLAKLRYRIIGIGLIGASSKLRSNGRETHLLYSPQYNDGNDEVDDQLDLFLVGPGGQHQNIGKGRYILCVESQKYVSN